ncbi:hypothetical protein [Helicobacter labacensis]|uniref:hypothetical protein n=1 Tax=Helicobacter labacensis TaxID=2316079 RepID=UPI000EACA762|nr:hypothetical protein [Helicobacter labacensis]
MKLFLGALLALMGVCFGGGVKDLDAGVRIMIDDMHVLDHLFDRYGGGYKRFLTTIFTGQVNNKPLRVAVFYADLVAQNMTTEDFRISGKNVPTFVCMGILKSLKELAKSRQQKSFCLRHDAFNNAQLLRLSASVVFKKHSFSLEVWQDVAFADGYPDTIHQSYVFKPNPKGFLLDAYLYEEYGGIEGEDPDTGEAFRIQPGKNIYYSQARDKQSIFLSSINDALLNKLREQCYKSKHCKRTELQKVLFHAKS